MSDLDLNSQIKIVSRKLEIRENLVAKFLRAIGGSSPMKSADLVRLTGIPQTNLFRLIKEFSEYLKQPSDYIELKDDLSPIPFPQKTTKSTILNILNKYQKNRPKPNRDLDQFIATRFTTAKRAVKLSQNWDINGKSLAFLGDDDLTSVAVALIGKPQKITVFEIDERLINLINQISLENNLSIEVIKQDLVQNIDQSYLNQFDIVFTDPPYTPSGISLFLNQAISLVKKNLLSRIYLCYGNSDRAREREVEIQKIILDHGLMISSKVHNFNRYFGAESIGSSSSLYLLDWTPLTHGVKTDNNKIYTHE